MVAQVAWQARQRQVEIGCQLLAHGLRIVYLGWQMVNRLVVDCQAHAFFAG